MAIAPRGKEYMGFPTQKPEKLLTRIIEACSQEGDTILDAYCGCGTSVSVAQRLKRNWVGIDITYHSIALIMRRLEKNFGEQAFKNIRLDGIPKDLHSAQALALKQDDRLRKEFEKWFVITYTNNRAIINDKKGGDKGIDGTSFFMTSKDQNAKIVFQVKSGSVGRGDIAKFNSDRLREGAELGMFLTLQPATQGMKDEANSVGRYEHKLMCRTYNRIGIVTVADLLERGARLQIPMSLEVLAAAQQANESKQMVLPSGMNA